MAETIRFAVVRWNPKLQRAQAIEVTQTNEIVDRRDVMTVRQAGWRIIATHDGWTGQDIAHYFASVFNLPSTLNVAVVEVSYGL